MTDVVQFISVGLCRPSPTARPVQPILVEILARSIAEVGLRQPINVRPLADGYEIRGGGHRYAAFVSLGRETIPAFVRADDDLHAELAEIDENLIRNELSPAERAISIARRKAIYEALHPETVHGAIGGGREQSRQLGDSASKAPRFTKDTAETTGASERSIQRDAGRGEKISEEHLRAVTGTSLDKGEELDALANLPRDKRANLVDRAKAGEKVSAKGELKKDARETRERDLGAKQTALPDKKYGVILADPEWRFEPWSRESGMDRAADNHYPTSELAEIANTRDVASIAAADCVLFLCATAPMLPQAFYVMEAWGFARFDTPRCDALSSLLSTALAEHDDHEGAFEPEYMPEHWTHAARRILEERASGRYASNFVWAKDRIGTGYWNRNKHEHLLIGVRGNIPAPAMGTQWDSLIEAAVGKHSEKPDAFYELIEAYFPTLPKIELNARRRREGWDAWGLEAPGSDSSRAAEGATTGGLSREEPAGVFHDADLPSFAARDEPFDPETGEIMESVGERGSAADVDPENPGGSHEEVAGSTIAKSLDVDSRANVGDFVAAAMGPAGVDPASRLAAGRTADANVSVGVTSAASEQAATNSEISQGRSGTAREAPSTDSGTTAETPSVGTQSAAPHQSRSASASGERAAPQNRPPSSSGAVPDFPDIPPILDRRNEVSP